MAGCQYYLWLNEQECGPFSRAELRHQSSKNWIPKACLCWHEGMEGWEPIEQVLSKPAPNLSPAPSSRESLTALRDELRADIEAGRKQRREDA